MTRTWIRRLSPRPVMSTIRTAPPRVSLAVQMLEGRWAPAALVVNNFTDMHVTGELNLREAILQANATQGNHIITFDTSVFNTPRTIVLTAGQLELLSGPGSGTKTIVGPTQRVTISGNNSSRVFQIGGGTTAFISGLTISDGYTRDVFGPAKGSGLYNLGNLSLTNCTVSGNTASSVFGGGLGAGLYNHGSVYLTNCNFSANKGATEHDPGKGGGIFSIGLAALTNCTLMGNYSKFGGGLYNAGGIAALTNCTVSGNTGTEGGGGLYNAGEMSLTNCAIRNNRASGQLYSAGVGGGVSNYEGTVTLTNCTVSGNTAGFGGGGLYNRFGNATLTNCTVSNNFGYSRGGGVVNLRGTSTLTNCTVSGNRTASRPSTYGGGLFNFAGTATSGNTIVAGNNAAVGPDASGFFASQGNNLISNTAGSGGWGGSDLTGIDPLFNPLANYGGPTQTMALLPSSPAIDAGNNALIPAGITTDERGRPRIVNGRVDIGAFESSGFTIAVTSGSGQSASITAPFPNSLVVTVTARYSLEPVAGGRVTFAAPNSGASAVIGGSPATINPSGRASVAATANAIPGGPYTVSAMGTGVFIPAAFSLTNFVALVVNNPNDTPVAGEINLRQAIIYANSFTTGAATITFDPAVFGTPKTILLTAGPLELSNTFATESITGPPAGVTISGNHSSQVFQVHIGVTAFFSGLTISSGNSSNGGGLLNRGTATLTYCTVSNNSAAFGGGLYNFGTATLTNCTISGNSAAGSEANNNGGGLYNRGTAMLTNCTVSGNSATYGGGLGNASILWMTKCTVSGNSAYGDLGGGGGGGLYNPGTATLTNCTVSGNQAHSNGGGLFNSAGMMSLTNCTFSGNSTRYDGGGLLNDRGTATIKNTIVAGNSGASGPDANGAFDSRGNNLIGKTGGSSGWVAADLTGSSADPLDPKLGPLQNNGGPTQTQALLPGSPAIRRGASVSGVTTDQRGFPLDNPPDIGAFQISLVATVLGAGPGGQPLVTILDGTGAVAYSFNAYDARFTGGVEVAAADVNGDGVDDIITGAGPGGGPHVKVFDGMTGNLVASFFAYDAGFAGGVNVAAADVDGDDVADIITGAGPGGGPHVKVFDGNTGNLLASFFAFDASFAGGVNVAARDQNGDGASEIIAGAGAGGGPHVKVFDGMSGNLVASFFAYDAGFAGGVSVAAADVNGDGVADIITGAGPGGGPHVKVFDGNTGNLLASFFAFDASFAGGVNVAARDQNGDGASEIITGAGAGGGSHVKVFDGMTGNLLASFFAYDAGFTGGVNVAAG